MNILGKISAAADRLLHRHAPAGVQRDEQPVFTRKPFAHKALPQVDTRPLSPASMAMINGLLQNARQMEHRLHRENAAMTRAPGAPPKSADKAPKQAPTNLSTAAPVTEQEAIEMAAIVFRDAAPKLR